MLGTYAAALLVIGASVPIGAAVLALSGRREWSWIGPGLGLGVMLAAAWLAVRLPGEGATALIVILLLAVASGVWGIPRAGPGWAEVREGGLVSALALIAVSIPFLVEGHVGVLGTGFNVDMSQHLFTAEWISTQLGPAPPLIDQGYPVGPHSLAVATAELSRSGGELVNGFTGITIAVPVIGAMVALAGTRSLGRWRGVVAALLVALPYLVASYLAQGAFKELFEALFLLAFALWLRELTPADFRTRGYAIAGAALVVGAVYSYSGPGLVWLIGALGLWIAIELVLDRSRVVTAARAGLPGLAIAAVVLAIAIAPEAGRMADFGGSAGNVANAAVGVPDAVDPLHVQAGSSDAQERRPDNALDLFDNSLGNLFGDIPPAEMLGIWPSGDFRVEPGDGAVPAIAFALGTILGLAALAVGVIAAIRSRETALLAALAAAIVIWLAAWLLSTPYTTAKALQMIAPLLMLVSLRGVLGGLLLPASEGGAGIGSGMRAVRVGFAAAFVVAALGSSALALANTPVGPERYSAGIGKLRERLTGEPLLLLAPAGQLVDRHGAEFYGWELRGGRPICIEAFPEEGDGFGRPAPEGIRYVITLGAKSEPPFTDLREEQRRRRVTLWEADDYAAASAPPVEIDPDVPTSCALGLSDSPRG